MRRRKYIFAGGTTLAAILAGCAGESESSSGGSSSGSGSGSGSTPTSTQSQYAYTESGLGIISSDIYNNDAGNLIYGGDAVNITDSEMSYVQINVEFLDSSNSRVETSLANTNNLAAGQTWRWEAVYPGMDWEEKVESIGIIGIEAY